MIYVSQDRAPAAGNPWCTTGMPALPDGQAGGRRGHVDSFAAHIPTPRTPLAHRVRAFGLTRFACPSLRRGLRRPVDSLRLPTALAPTLAFDRQQQGPTRRRARRGRKPRGTGGGTPPAKERHRRGQDAGGRSEPRSGYTPLFGPPAGGLVRVTPKQVPGASSAAGCPGTGLGAAAKAPQAHALRAL